MPSHSELPGNLKRKKLISSLVRLGFEINQVGGNGSHFKAMWKNNKSVTLPNKLPRQTLYYILKEIDEVSGIKWKDIKDNF